MAKIKIFYWEMKSINRKEHKVGAKNTNEYNSSHSSSL
jgi:hypothetical protein